MSRPFSSPSAVDPWTKVRRQLTAITRAPSPLLLVADFDGTLAAITGEPEAARIHPAARAALRRLSSLSARHPARLTIAVLSGRTVADVAARVRVGGVLYVGNHGLEWCRLPRRAPEGGRRQADPRVDLPQATWLRASAEAVVRAAGGPDWLLLEWKGPAVALHYRAAPDPVAARRSVLDAIGAVERDQPGAGFERLEGRRVVELRPRGAPGKGTTLRRMIAGELDGLPVPSSTVILGDDRTDADAFRAVRAAREDGRLRGGLIVGVSGGEETPREVAEAADVIVADSRGVARVLDAIADRVEREG